MKDESLAIRNLATIVYRLGGGKESIDHIWPLEDKERETIKPITREFWDNIKKTQMVIDKNISLQRLKNKR